MILGQTILVVGGSRGIGHAVAEAAADAGAHVIIASREPDRATRAIGENVRAETVDIRDEASICGLMERIGSFDHLIATPAFDHDAVPVTEMERSVVEGLFQTKFVGQYLLAKHAAAHLSERGSIVLTSGVLSIRPAAGWAALGAMNAAIEALTQSLALELAPRRVNVVVPGLVDTGKRFTSLSSEARTEKLRTTFADKLPTRRLGQPQDLASAYLFAIQNPYFTGQSLVVDGGGALV